MQILLHLKDNFGKMLYQKYILEQNIEFDKISSPSKSIQIEIQTGGLEKNMNKADIFEAAKYIVALHYKADKQYTCNRTKIEKMLAIADLISIKDDMRLFPTLMIFINNCGVGYNVLSKDIVRFPMDNIIDGNEESLTKYTLPKPTITLDYDRAIPDLYLTDNLCDYAKKILEDVFLEFSPYSAKFIGSLMDEFKDKIKSAEPSIHNSKYYIDVEQARKFFTLENQIFEANFVAKYITEYHK